MIRLAVTGAVETLTAAEQALLLERGRAGDPAVRSAVAELIAEVRRDGDAALRAQALRFDGVTLDALEVPRARWEQALAALDPELRAALEEARANIAAFHAAQLPLPLEIETRPGVVLGRRAEPLRRVGVYAPGGRAAYPSSVLMGVVPAKVAGVLEVIVCSPAGPDGLPPPAVLAAAALAGADRVFALGGAGAIAALAYGTESVPAVAKVVGPGNAYVTEAKRALTGVIAIDSPAGPSEVLVLADEGADPRRIAAELLAQAEHDPDAGVVLVTTSATVQQAVARELEALVPAQPRREIIEAALAAAGALLTAADMDAAIAFAERYAPEHLSVMTADPRALLPRLRAAGTIFLGSASSVAFGDYLTGANHVLPTAGLARAYAGLATADFLRMVTYQELTEAAAARCARPTELLAGAEGLPAHAFAAALRAEPDPGAGAPSAPLLRPAYRAIALYEPGREPCATDLSDNTNLFGPPPSLAAVLAGLDARQVTRYPTVWARELKAALAAYHGVGPENVATGCGSDDLLDSAARAFAEPGDALAYPDPTFGVVATFARMNALRPVAVPLEDGALPVDALLAARARLTYVCTPNNPTGTSFDPAGLARLVAGSPGIVLLDRAYADYDDATCELPVETPRLLVIRTFSKALGLAGLRVGYALGPAALIRELEKSRGPYKVGGVAEAAALAVLREDGAWVRRCIEAVKTNRAQLASALRARGWQPLPSNANFLLLPTGGADAGELARRLRARGVAVRAFPAMPGVGDALRVSVGPWPMLQSFLNALDAVRQVEVER